jgi:adenine-specific DNA-methyltransferase
MASLTDNQKKLMDKLAEMFQFDQADLDFGIYRIMNYKRSQIKRFLEEDLMAQISAQLAELSQSSNAAELAKLDQDLQNAQSMDLDESIKAGMIAKLKEKKAAYTVNSDITTVEADIYSHLTEFFSRYYDEGDFISQRRYKDGVYAIPYEGEEVKLHWANADQYYVKTSEYFKDYTFKTPFGQTVHFKIAEAETEKDNNKGKNRFFQLYAERPFTLENGELFICFEYKAGDKKKQADYNAFVIAEFAKVVAQYPDFAALLKVADGKSLLERQLSRYTARNTFDYFIHKDLGNFLNRELDFYIKNDVIFLDDIDEQDERKTKEYLLKAKIIRNIGKKIIAFLAQIEDFQKTLWLKKKFVVETNYCITLDRIPKKLYQQIIENKTQVEEWVRLFAIDEIKPTEGNLLEAGKPGFSNPLTIEFMEQNPYLVLDTAFFPAEFKEQLIDSIDNLDDSLDGLLIHSENFQALNLLHESYRELVQSVYIDPPYNTDATKILYKNGYEHSSWNSLILDRLSYIRPLLKRSGLICVTIDDYELYSLKNLLDLSFGVENFLANVLIRNNPSGRSTVSGFAINHEYALFYSRLKSDCMVGRLPHTSEQRERYDITDESGKSFEWENFRKNSSGSYRNDRPKQFYPILINKPKNTIRIPQLRWNDTTRAWDINETIPNNETVVYPIDEQGRERVWRYGIDRASNETSTMRFTEKNGTIEIYKRKYFQEAGSLPRTWWDKADYSARDNGTRAIVNILGEGQAFEFPKATGAVMDCLKVTNCTSEAIAFDCFAGSGTTAHAVINLNREDDGSRKYILVEMGEYFDTVTKPRVQKVIYSEDWKDGKPVSRRGSSHAIKYLRLESYEDTLNNIEIEEGTLKFLTNPTVKEQYMLQYMLPDETRGSASLLNIDLLEHPFDYAMNITRRQESRVINIDLVETFNYLIGLKVERSFALQSFDADFTTSEYGAVTASLKNGATYRFKMVEGATNSGDWILVIWRDLTGDKIKDNAVLDAFFERKKTSAADFEYKRIHVNGDNNLPNLRTDNESWKVILIEEEMKKHMFSTENI